MFGWIFKCLSVRPPESEWKAGVRAWRDAVETQTLQQRPAIAIACNDLFCMSPCMQFLKNQNVSKINQVLGTPHAGMGIKEIKVCKKLRGDSWHADLVSWDLSPLEPKPEEPTRLVQEWSRIGGSVTIATPIVCLVFLPNHEKLTAYRWNETFTGSWAQNEFLICQLPKHGWDLPIFVASD